MINFSPIERGLFVGTCPGNEIDIERLSRGPRITAVLNLQTDTDLQELGIDWAHLEDCYVRHGLLVRRWPIRDFDPEHLQSRIRGAAALLAELRDAGHEVYVHCTSGVSRAPSVVTAFLVWHRGWDLETAGALVMQKRACSPHLDRIRAAGDPGAR